MASFLDNVVLEDFDFILEGEQAEAYKKRKAEEHEDEFRNNQKRTDSRMNAGRKNPNGYVGDKHVYDDLIRKDLSSAKAHKMMKQSKRANLGDYVTAKDAVNRHMRRHPQKESTFFDDVELI